MKRTARLTRRKRMPRQSPKRRAAKLTQASAYDAADDAEQCWCSVCGKPGPTEHSHHLSQHHYPEHANDQRNWLVMGKYCGCHDFYENNRRAFAAAYPKLWRTILAAVRAVDETAYRAFRLRYPF